jgi:hypothetical protein
MYGLLKLFGMESCVGNARSFPPVMSEPLLDKSNIPPAVVIYNNDKTRLDYSPQPTQFMAKNIITYQPSTRESLQKLSNSIRIKYPSHVPIIVSSDAFSLYRNKMMVPNDIFMSRLKEEIIKIIDGTPEKITIIVNETVVTPIMMSILMSDIYSKYCSPDGFLYVIVV